MLTVNVKEFVKENILGNIHKWGHVTSKKEVNQVWWVSGSGFNGLFHHKQLGLYDVKKLQYILKDTNIHVRCFSRFREIASCSVWLKITFSCWLWFFKWKLLLSKLNRMSCGNHNFNFSLKRGHHPRCIFYFVCMRHYIIIVLNYSGFRG